jgi:acrylyl-CoA reductase (NADPH)
MRAVLIEEDARGYRCALKNINEHFLPDGDVTVRIYYSTLNFKDALAITGSAPVVRTFPIVPGVDFAGIVEESTDARFRVGDPVLLNGWGAGESHWGGLAEFARVKGDWLLPVPHGLTQRQAMAIGSAGYIAMLCVLQLERHGVTPQSGEIVVTGAACGTGSLAISILANLGHHVVAVSSRPEQAEFLRNLGAREVLPDEMYSGPSSPLAKPRWAGAIDVVGGNTLANVCATMRYQGVVTCCGGYGRMEFPGSLAPFVQRAVTLVGVESTMCPRPLREIAWQRLATDLPRGQLDAVTEEISLERVIDAAHDLLSGHRLDRLVVGIRSS